MMVHKREGAAVGFREQMRQRWVASGMIAALVGTVMSTLGLDAGAFATPFAAVPSPPAVVFNEDFEHGPVISPILRLNQYSGANGQTYTADPPWLINCNGWIAAADQAVNSSAQVTDCGGQAPWNQAQQASEAAALFHGANASTALTNRSVSANTNPGNPGAGRIEFATTANIPLPTASRFLALSLDVMAYHCQAAHPLLQMYLVNPAGQATPAGSQIDGCSSSAVITVPALGASGSLAVNVGTFVTNSAVLFSGSSIGIRMVNNQASGNGNDHGFDNVRVVDATPQLNKEFLSQWTPTGGTSRVRFTITNTSELGAKDGWAFQDDLPPGLVVASPANASSTCPGATVNASGPRISASGNLAVGMASCTVEADVTAPAAGTYVNTPDRLTVLGLNPPAGSSATQFSSPAISLVKTAGTPEDINQDGLVDAGDVIPYTFTVTDTGDVALTAVAVNDSHVAAACPSSSLDPGISMDCTGDYTITPADAAAGEVVNTATASGTPPEPAPGAVSTPSSTRIPVTAARPALEVVKSADTLDLIEGDDVTYRFVVSNTGNLPLNGIALHETVFTGAGTMTPVSCPTSTLSVGAQMECTSQYTITAQDLLVGTVANTAVATATPAGVGATEISSAPASFSLPSPTRPDLTAEKSAAPDTVTAAGQHVHYTVDVTDSGNITVQNVSVQELAFSGTGPRPSFTCTPSTLVPGETATCSGDYMVTQADIDRGSIQNTAAAAGVLPDGATSVTSGPSTATVTAISAPAIDLAKTSTTATITAAGQVVPYLFTVTNAGNRTLSGITVADTMAPPANPGNLTPVVCAVTTLPPQRSTTCTAEYTVTQDDVDSAGPLTDTAVAQAAEPGGTTISSPNRVLRIPVAASPSISVVKDTATTAITRPGQAVPYTFTVTNTGNQTLRGVVVEDTVAPPAEPTHLSPVTCPFTILAPQSSTTCTASYTVTQDDLDHGSVADTATVTAVPPTGTPLPPSTPSTKVVPVDQRPSLSMVKSVFPLADPSFVVGEALTYTYEVTNTGNVTISGVGIDETQFSGSGPAPTPVCPPGDLAPGAQLTCTATYTVTQPDVDSGEVTNTAHGIGTPPGGGVTSSGPSSAITPFTAAPALTILKSVSPAQVDAAGTPVKFSFVVTNTGNVTLNSVSVIEDGFSGSGAPPVPSCPVTTLSPGQFETCTADYAITQDDMDAGTVSNTAHAVGTAVGAAAPTLSTPSSAVIDVTTTAKLTVTKASTTTEVTKLGQVIPYTFTVTNTGNQTLRALDIIDTPIPPPDSANRSPIDCPVTTLAPGASSVCTGSHTVSQEDLDAGAVTDRAIASAQSPHTTVSADSNSLTIPVTGQTSSLTVTKTANTRVITGAGQVITYSFLVVDTGTLTLHAVTVSDSQAFPEDVPESPPTCPTAILRPGTSMTCTASLIVSPAAATRGHISDTAVANAMTTTGTIIHSAGSTVRLASEPLPATGGRLPPTGDAESLWIPPLMLLGLGGALLLLSRRRRRRT